MGREAEVFLQSVGTVLKLMRGEPDGLVAVEREAAVCRLLAEHG